MDNNVTEFIKLYSQVNLAQIKLEVIKNDLKKLVNTELDDIGNIYWNMGTLIIYFEVISIDTILKFNEYLGISSFVTGDEIEFDFSKSFEEVRK